MSETPSEQPDLTLEAVETAVRNMQAAFDKGPRDIAFKTAMYDLEELSQVDREKFMELVGKLQPDLKEFVFKKYMA